jgi:hypothetical protein
MTDAELIAGFQKHPADAPVLVPTDDDGKVGPARPREFLPGALDHPRMVFVHRPCQLDRLS